MSLNKWSYGIEEDDDCFHGAETKEEALSKGEALAKEFGADYFHIAEDDEPEIPAIEPRDLIDILNSDGPECWTDNMTEEQETAMTLGVNKYIEDFLREHKLITWRGLKNIQKIDLNP